MGENNITALSTENYKWGFSFQYPLFLRKERGAVQVGKLQLKDTELKIAQKRREINNKVKGYYNQQLAYADQLEIAGEMVNNYYRLLDAEKTKFAIGESSLFLINSREVTLLSSREKQIDLFVKYRQNLASLLWSAGGLADAVPRLQN